MQTIPAWLVPVMRPVSRDGCFLTQRGRNHTFTRVFFPVDCLLERDFTSHAPIRERNQINPIKRKALSVVYRGLQVWSRIDTPDSMLV